MKIKILVSIVLLSSFLLGCDDDDTKKTIIDEPLPTPTPIPALKVGSSSQSLLPTVDGSRDYLSNAPGWPSAADVDPDDPGVFIADWDQGQVNVGNGEDDASWVHDDVRVTSVAMEYNDEKVVLVSANTYMHLSQDIDKIIEIAQEVMPTEWQDAEILMSASHNHHGPSTAFSPNVDWYQMAAEQVALSITDAISAVEPAVTKVATGMHGYGAWDQQDPRITDDRLNVMTIDSFESGEPIATIVQWASHPETTLGFKPSPTKVRCIASEEDCDAEDRYFSGDFPSVLETRLKESRGGEVLYLNGAIGVLVATLHAPAWLVTEEHPITGDGRTVPEGATALTPNCDEKYECLSFLKTESVGNELFKAVDKLIQEAEEFDITEISISKEYFYTRMTNMGFRALFAEGGIGWQYRDNFNCDMPLSDDNCVEVEGAKIDDPLVAAFTGWQVTKGDFIKTSVVRVDFGSVGMLFMPGELPGELLIGLPDDFVTAATATYYKDPDEHAAASDYNIPGHLLALPDEEITFTVGLGTDELGYFVPLDDYRIFCSDDVVGAVAGMTCSELQGLGAIEGEKWVSGERCKAIVEGDEATLIALGAVAPVVGAVCRYGQMVGRAPGHYHETNSVGWDLVQDLWSAAEKLYQD